MPDLTTKDALLEKIVSLLGDISQNIVTKFGEYLPLAGGNITGGLTVQNNSVVTTKVVDLASLFSINITSGNATHLSAALIVKKIGNIIQLYIGFTTTTAINVGGTISATISGISLPIVPCGFVGYTGSVALIGILNGSELSIRITGANLVSNTNFAVCIMYAVAE